MTTGEGGTYTVILALEASASVQIDALDSREFGAWL